jgi:hypothetical protein
MAEGQGGGGLPLGPIIGVLGKTLDTGETLVHALTPDAAQAVGGVTNVLGGVATAASGAVEGAGQAVAGVGQALPVPVVSPVIVKAGDTVAAIGGAINTVTAPVTPSTGATWNEPATHMSLLVKLILAGLGFFAASGTVPMPAAAQAAVLAAVPVALSIEHSLFTWASTSQKNPPH